MAPQPQTILFQPTSYSSSGLPISFQSGGMPYTTQQSMMGGEEYGVPWRFASNNLFLLSFIITQHFKNCSTY